MRLKNDKRGPKLVSEIQQWELRMAACRKILLLRVREQAVLVKVKMLRNWCKIRWTWTTWNGKTGRESSVSCSQRWMLECLPKLWLRAKMQNLRLNAKKQCAWCLKRACNRLGRKGKIMFTEKPRATSKSTSKSYATNMDKLLSRNTWNPVDTKLKPILLTRMRICESRTTTTSLKELQQRTNRRNKTRKNWRLSMFPRVKCKIDHLRNL